MKKGNARVLGFLLTTSTLSACVDLQEQRQIEDEKRQEAARAEVDMYCSQLYSDPRLDPIRAKMPIGKSITEPVPVQMMTNSDLPTQGEKSAILAWAQQRQLCQQKDSTLFGPPYPHLEAARRANSQSIADLYGGKITYGQYAKFLNELEAHVLQEDQAVRAQAARDFLDAQRTADQHFYQQQQIMRETIKSVQPREPVQCTTSYVGNQAYTNCR